MSSAEGRFWSRVDKTDGCWLWTKGTSNGYGVYYADGKEWLAHRYALTITSGPIPPGKFACHTCDVRLCVRPSHLYAGDHRTNGADASRNRRWPAKYAKPLARKSCRNGHVWTPANIYVKPDGRRRCRECRRIARKRESVARNQRRKV